MPATLRQQSDNQIILIAETAHFLQSQYGDFELEYASLLNKLHEYPDHLNEYANNRKDSVSDHQRALESLTKHLSDLPAVQGVLLEGSFAVDYKRSKFSDLDLACVCTELPSDEMRDDVLKKVGATSGVCRFGCFEYIGLPNVNIHLNFILIKNQETAFRRLYEEGQEVSWGRGFKVEDFAIPPYGWATGRILYDPDGILASFQRQISKFPVVLQGNINRTWATAWNRYRRELQKAQQVRDRVTELTALHICNEAALRVFLAFHQVYCNPYKTKWIPSEIANLPEDKRQQMGVVLEYMPSDTTVSWQERFDKVHKLWDIVNRTK